jgi:hypothetical protein
MLLMSLPGGCVLVAELARMSALTGRSSSKISKRRGFAHYLKTRTAENVSTALRFARDWKHPMIIVDSIPVRCMG